MLITAIQVRSIAKAQLQMRQAFEQTDGFELRLDYCEFLDFDALKNLRSQCTKPLIFTLRRADQGGQYQGPEAERLQFILDLCALAPDYFDLEYDVPREFVAKVHALYPNIQLISSYHDFDQTPEDLAGIVALMQQPFISIYKLATFAHSLIDALRMLCFIQASKVPFAGMCMGADGEITRVLGPVVGNALDYASASSDEATAPGQLSVQDLHALYHYPSLNRHTKIYGVFGDPVAKSVGYLLHNQAICLLHKNAVYVRLRVSPDDLPLAIQLCRTLPFGGASVTMPLKEVMLPLLDKLDEDAAAIKAVNTIVVRDHLWQGFNTDGLGAIAALEAHGSVAQQKVVILGAGGAAKAIAFVALQKGARVLILNRTLARAAQLAEDLGCEAGGLDILAHLADMDYKILINTLPVGEKMDALLKASYLKPGTVAMDIVYAPIETAFLKIAKQAGCVCVPGYQMYIGQALLQEQYWFDLDHNHVLGVRELMERYFLGLC